MITMLILITLNRIYIGISATWDIILYLPIIYLTVCVLNTATAKTVMQKKRKRYIRLYAFLRTILILTEYTLKRLNQ